MFNLDSAHFFREHRLIFRGPETPKPAEQAQQAPNRKSEPVKFEVTKEQWKLRDSEHERIREMGAKVWKTVENHDDLKGCEMYTQVMPSFPNDRLSYKIFISKSIQGGGLMPIEAHFIDRKYADGPIPNAELEAAVKDAINSAIREIVQLRLIGAQIDNQ
jgi:hypothetical protein